jgi:hypothetical protein
MFRQYRPRVLQSVALIGRDDLYQTRTARWHAIAVNDSSSTCVQHIVAKSLSQRIQALSHMASASFLYSKRLLNKV